MYIKISKSEFRDAFARGGRKDQFSYEALGALYDYYIKLEASSGDPIELDLAEICESWTEYNDLEDFKAENDEIDDLDDLKAETEVIEIPPRLSFGGNEDYRYRGGGLLVREF